MSRNKNPLVVGLMVAIGSIGSLPVISEQVQAQTPKEGWASQTGYRNAETGVQRSAVAYVYSKSGALSGPSIYNSGVWLTDVDNGKDANGNLVNDGACMRAAITRYHYWYTFNGPNANDAGIRTAMKTDFASDYPDSDKNQLVDWIIKCYKQEVLQSPLFLPTDQQSTLSFLRIQAQCLEFAGKTAQKAGGTARPYPDPKKLPSWVVTDSSKFRPGMGFFRTDKSHAAVLIDICWDRNGNPTQYKLGEANADNVIWHNPTGMIPWTRTVHTGRTVYGSNGWNVISFE
jgi:hypothetical protein